jgi:hypothetical protein
MNDDQIERVRRLCAALPNTEERLSHGEPTWFVKNKVFAMFANNHHNDGHIAVYVPTPPGAQAGILATDPHIYFRPPYVGVRGWVGIELHRITDEALRFHLQVAYDLIAPPPKPAARLSRKTAQRR